VASLVVFWLLSLGEPEAGRLVASLVEDSAERVGEVRLRALVLEAELLETMEALVGELEASAEPVADLVVRVVVSLERVVELVEPVVDIVERLVVLVGESVVAVGLVVLPVPPVLVDQVDQVDLVLPTLEPGEVLGFLLAIARS